MNPVPPRYSKWSLVCQSVRSSAQSMGQSRSKTAADLIDNQADVFCSQLPPKNGNEQDQRQQQRDDLTGRLNFITYADEVAKRNPKIAEKVFELVRQYLEVPLATSSEEAELSMRRRLELTQSIARL